MTEEKHYVDCNYGYPTVETKIIKANNLTKLYSLNEYQKSFAAHITFKIEVIDTFNINVAYNIPSDVALIINFSLNDFNEEINKALLNKSADYITTHLIVMQIIMKKFNSHLIGVCLNKEIENLIMKQRKKRYEMYDSKRDRRTLRTNE